MKFGFRLWKIGYTLFLAITLSVMSIGFYESSHEGHNHSLGDNTHINIMEETGSVIDPTEKLTIDNDANSAMKEGLLVVERDVIPLSQFNPWKDYGKEELENIMISKTGGQKLAKDYMTMHIESSHYIEDALIVSFNKNWYKN